MGKIKEIIDIRAGYSDTVDIQNDFKREKENKQRMSTYRPIKSHRQAFEIIAEAPFIKDSKRCFILSGSYGTGKSHLGLITANYFSIPSTTDEMNTFFKLYEEAENEDKEINKKAQMLKNRRKDGKFLVCICDYINGTFDSLILRAIKEALIRENIDSDEINSIYKQALIKIDEWENSENNYFFNEFINILESDDSLWTLGRMKKELEDYNKEALGIFKSIHKKVTTAEFDYSADNLVEIINSLSGSKGIREKFKGLIIIFDEFDYQLKNKRFELDTFQKFGQMCLDSFTNNFPITFIATTHKSFISYKNVYNDTDFKTVSDRVKEIPMVTSGIEDIIGAIVVPKKESEVWRNEVIPNKNIFNQLATDCGSLDIFNWLSRPKLRNKIIENIYPMHPLATFALLELAKDLGSNNRSVFKFFSSNKKEYGSYDWFIENNEVLNSKKELQLYTVDNLYYYFQNTITTDNTELRNKLKDVVKNYETSLREYNKCIINPENLILKSDIYARLLRVMVILSMIDIPVNFNNLKFGLNFASENENIELKNSLDLLVKNKIVFINEQNNCYEFKKSDALDVFEIVKEKMEDEGNIPDNIFKEISNIIKNNDIRKIKSFFKNNQFIEAKGYNSEYTEDKRFKIEFASLKDIDSKKIIDDLSNKILLEYEKENYDGILLNITCETEDELKKARELAKLNNSDRIIIAIPNEEISIFNDVFTLKVAVTIDKSNFSSQDLAMLKDIVNRYDEQLTKNLELYLDSKRVIYYGKDGKILAQNSNDKYLAINKAMTNLFYKKRNIIKHDGLNYSHNFNERKNQPLKEAVENILCLSKYISFNVQQAADKGETKYLKNVLYQYSLIKEYSKQGDIRFCEINTDLERYRINFPALADMIKVIKERKTDINIINFIEKYSYEYGLGYNSIMLFFSFVLRYFKDNVIIIQDVNEVGSLKVETYEILLDLVYNKKYRNAVIRYKEITSSQKKLVEELNKIFVKDNSNDNITIDELYRTMKSWFLNLKEINKVEEIYDNVIVKEFLHDFKRIDKINSHTFILEGIQKICGYDLDDLILDEDISIIISKVKEAKESVEKGYYVIREKIFNNIRNVFNSAAITEDGLLQEIKEWYRGLTEIQRNPNTNLHDRNSEIIVRSLAMDLNFEKLFMEQLPGIYGFSFGNVEDWSKDYSDTFIQKFINGKNYVENICIVDEPAFDVIGTGVREKQSSLKNSVDIYYRDNIKIIIKAKDEHKYIYLTSNNSDPRKEYSQRQEDTQKIIYESSENKTLKFVAKDNEGRFSKTVVLNIINESKKYEARIVDQGEVVEQIDIKEDQQQEIPKIEPKIEVTLPKDEESLKRCIKSIIQIYLNKYNSETNNLIKVFEEVLNEVQVHCNEEN